MKKRTNSGKKVSSKENAILTMKQLFDSLSIEDKVKAIDALVDPIKKQIDRIICDTYDPHFDGCSEFFIEDSCVYCNSPSDYKTERCMTACSYSQDNISFPLRWLDENCDYKAEYKKICDAEEARDKAYVEHEERDMLRRLKAKYES